MAMRTMLALATLVFTFAGTGTAIELDESPARVGEWGYRPDDGSTPTLNPPGFSWRPARDPAFYVVEIARDRAFADVVHKRDGIRWSAYCPPGILPAGALYWRYAATDGEGNRSSWSRVRSFNVTEDAVPFPKPTAAELVERMSEEHPRLFFRPEDIPNLRELAAGALADNWRDLQSRADKLIENPPDTTEPLLYPKGTVRKGNEWKKIWWGNRRKVIAVADAAATLSFVYRLSGDEKYARAARDLLLAMTEWDTDGSTNLRYNDEAAMPALYMTSRAYSWAYPVLSDEDRAAVAAMMRVRGGQAYKHLTGNRHLWFPYRSHSNRLWHFLGEIGIAFHGDFPEAETWLEYAMTVLYTAYPVWGDDDGGWHEGTGYWASYTGRFMYWASIVRSAFGIDVFERPFYRRTGYYGLYNLPPGSGPLGFGDQAAPSSRIAPLMAVLAAGAQNPHWQWYADAAGGTVGGGYLGFLYASRAIDVPATPPVDLPTSACFRGIGLAVLNTDLLDGTRNVQVQLKSSPMGRKSHGYNSNNALLLNLRGQRVLQRSGRRDVHGSKHHTEWMWNTKSDNAILVNGEGQIKHDGKAQGRITFFETTRTVDAVVGEAGAAYTNLDRWTRRVVFFKPDVVLIHDVLEAPEPSQFQFLLHALNKMRVAPTKQRVTISRRGARCRVEFLAPGGLTFEQTDQFPVPPIRKAPNQWHLTASTGEPAAGAASLIVIQPYRDGQSDELLTATVEAGEGCVGVRLADAKRMLMVLFRTDPKAETVKLGDVATDAQAASVCTINGHAHSAVQFQGAWLACGDVSLVEGAPVWMKATKRARGPAPARLNVEGQKPARFKLTRYDQVLRLVARAKVGGPVVHREVQATVGNTGDGRLPVVVSVGAASVRRVLGPRQQDAEIVLLPAGLGRGQELVIMADEAFGGRLSIRAASARRVYGVNLLPHGSFEEVARNKPVGWRAGTITKQAKCAICRAPGGRLGDRCLKVTCIDATGGDFGAMLSWPGVAASEVDRKFRMGCWVKTDATSVAGLQVTSANWRWWKNTARLRDRKDWTETAIEFVLPAGENIAHVRLHMSAKQTGAELFVDDVQLVELPVD